MSYTYILLFRTTNYVPSRSAWCTFVQNIYAAIDRTQPTYSYAFS